MTRTSQTRGSPPAAGAAPIKGDYRRYDPFRKPAWRWLRAEELLAQGRKPHRWEDPAITSALRYIRGRAGRSSRARGRSGPGDQVPDLTAAHAIYTGGGALRDEVEARLLSGQPLSDVSARTGVIPSDVEAYQAFFFDVADRLGAGDWLLRQAVRVGPWASCVPTEGQIWRYLAVAGGVPLLDLVVADFLGRPEPRYPDRQRLAERARFVVIDAAAGDSAAATIAFVRECRRLLGPRLRGVRGGPAARRSFRLRLKALEMLAGRAGAKRKRRQAPASHPAGAGAAPARAAVRPREGAGDAEAPKPTIGPFMDAALAAAGWHRSG